MNVLALDIETKNYSHEIGGWGNTHMFEVSTVCTWDGNHGTVYIDEPIKSIRKSGVSVKPLSQLKFDLDEASSEQWYSIGTQHRLIRLGSFEECYGHILHQEIPR